MVNETLTLWDNGAVTLPKRWREKYDTRHFIAKENERGYLVIMPILDVEYYENADGSFGLHFPTGIEMGEFVNTMDRIEQRIYKNKQKIKTTRAKGQKQKSSRKRS